MPSSTVDTSNASAPIARLTMTVESLRPGAVSIAAGAGGAIPYNYNCFDAGDE